MAHIHMLVFVYDPTDTDDVNIPVGKQTLRQSHIFYTPCSGIWQSVWIEAAPQSDYITQLDLSGDMDGQGSYSETRLYQSTNCSQ